MLFINGNASDDVLTGTAAAEIISGLGGNDTLLGGGGNDILYGGNNLDDLFGGAGSDLLFGGNGADILDGGSENDALYGDGGQDYLRGGAGADRLYGGSGADSAAYEASSAGVQVSLVTGVGKGGHAEGDTLDSIEDLVGSTFADVLRGNDVVNHLFGGEAGDFLDGGNGNDFLFGDGGNDTVKGGYGADHMDGGNGTDTLLYTAASGQSGVYVDLVSGTGTFGQAQGDVFYGFENIVGTAVDDIFLAGDNGVNRIDAGAGNDLVNGRGGGDSLIGGSGTDTLSYLGSSTGVTVNLATGAASGGWATGDSFSGFENIAGSHSNDVLTGNSGANELIGRGGDDSLLGGDSADRLIGEVGLDRMWGGAGADTFVWRFVSEGGVGAARDRVNDFSVADGDRIDLAAIDANAGLAGAQDFAFAGTSAFSGLGQVRFVHSGGNTVVQLNTEGSNAADMEILLSGIHDLPSAQFLL
jgi:Ca2+-binding RTX toxin-like protein